MFQEIKGHNSKTKKKPPVKSEIKLGFPFMIPDSVLKKPNAGPTFGRTEVCMEMDKT